MLLPAVVQDPRCTCGEAVHRQDCRVERERQQLITALASLARERLEERAAGMRAFPGTTQALRWYHRKLARWGTTHSPRMDPGEGRSPRPVGGPDRMVWAAVAFAIREAERELAPAPVSRWLAEHYALGRSYDLIGEFSGADRAEVGRVMARAHRLVRTRLTAEGWIETSGADE